MTQAKNWRDVDGVWARLTRTQSVVAAGICMGLDRKTISSELGISPKTYDSHRLKIMERLDVDNEVQLLRYAVGKGLVKLEIEP